MIVRKNNTEAWINYKIKIKENRKILIDFVNYAVATNKSESRIERYLDVIIRLSNIINKPFKSINRVDLQAYIKDLMQSDFTEWTKHTHLSIIKFSFFRWLYDCDKREYPPVVKWIECIAPKNEIKPEDVLTEEDIKKMIKAAKSLRDKTIIFLLFESGIRLGELRGLKIKDFSFGDQLCNMTVSGKTGTRRLPLIHCVPYLSTYIEKNTTRAPESYVFHRPGKPNHAITGHTTQKAIRIAAEKAGINKKVHHHMFRHSCASLLATKLNEQQLKMFMGWSRSSRMCGVYVHMSNKQLDDAYKEANGLEKEQKKRESKLKPVLCVRCEKLNGADVTMCHHCGMALTVEAALEFEKKKEVFTKAIANREDIRALIREEMKAILRK